VRDHSDWNGAANQRSELLDIQNRQGTQIYFVEQALLPSDTSYETFIYETGQVPTRNNLHDYFNALVWLSFPKIKGQLNTLQAERIKCDGIGASRGGTRDVATVFDENAALLVMRDDVTGRILLEALRNHEWHSVFIQQREQFITHCDVRLFGHALMEKLVTPYKAITAHAWAIFAPDEYFHLPETEQQSWLDDHVAAQLQHSAELSTAQFTPLPILGVPGWWSKQDEAFYADARVFRSKRI